MRRYSHKKNRNSLQKYLHIKTLVPQYFLCKLFLYARKLSEQVSKVTISNINNSTLPVTHYTCPNSFSIARNTFGSL